MFAHEPVLLAEAIDGLAIKENGVYIDATFGRGGHSRAILQKLSKDGQLIVMDKDREAIEYASQNFGLDSRFYSHHGSFVDLSKLSETMQLDGKVDGILMDLGVSSVQLDNHERGFSYQNKGPLDMRMDKSQQLCAADFINTAELDDMVRVFREYGEERFAKRIAKAIITARSLTPITTTDVLAEIIKSANPRWEKHKHPATRVFQAIRIYVNQELTQLATTLELALKVLAPYGRLVVISFHSLEDRIVKQFMQLKEHGPRLPSYLPIRHLAHKPCFKRVGKMIKATEEEVRRNNRSRSAILRIGEKQDECCG